MSTFQNKDYIFQQENAPDHNSISTRCYIADAGVSLLDWPGNSPDSSPIDSIWNLIKKRIGKSPLTKDNLWANIQSVWYGIRKSNLEPLYKSMPLRIQAVIEA